MGKKLEFKAGDKFGKWTVLEEVEPQISPCGAKTRMFKCRCECGTVRNVSGSSLNTEHSVSCGCYRAEWTIERNTTHGGKRTWLYREWIGAKRRAKVGGDWQKRFPTYVGVDIDPEWESSFEAFRDWALSRPDYAEGKELDRIDNTKGYYPWNCRWTDRKQQVRNTSRTRRYNGEALADLYDRECDCGISYKSFYNRVTKYGWDIETALHCKTRKRKIHNTKRTQEVNGVSLIDLYDRECDCGITYKSFYDRVVIKGWDVQTALHKVTRKSRGGVK